MHIKLDTRADALYIKLTKGKVYKTVATSDTFIIDADKKGNIIGIEVLNYSKTVPEKSERSSIFVGQKKYLLPA